MNQSPIICRLPSLAWSNSLDEILVVKPLNMLRMRQRIGLGVHQSLSQRNSCLAVMVSDGKACRFLYESFIRFFPAETRVDGFGCQPQSPSQAFQEVDPNTGCGCGGLLHDP